MELIKYYTVFNDEIKEFTVSSSAFDFRGQDEDFVQIIEVEWVDGDQVKWTAQYPKTYELAKNNLLTELQKNLELLTKRINILEGSISYEDYNQKIKRLLQ